MKYAAYSFLLVIFLLVIFLLPACDMLQQTPEDFLTPQNYYNSEKDAIAATNAIYSSLFAVYNNNWLDLKEIASDDMDSPLYSPFPRVHQFDDYTVDPQNALLTGAYSNFYNTINLANIVTNRVPEIDMDPELRERLVGEGYFLRAFQYFELVRMFGGVPLILEDNLDSLQVEVEATPAIGVYEQIISDFEEAETMLPESYPSSEKGRPTSGAATAFLAKVYLTLASTQRFDVFPDWNYPESAQAYYRNAEQKAKEVIDSGNYSLFEDYQYNFDVAHQNGKEHLFSYQMTSETYGFSYYWGTVFTPQVCDLVPGGGEAEWITTMDIFQAYEEDDYRRDVNFLTQCVTAEGDTMTWQEDFEAGVPLIGKYFDKNIPPLENRDVNNVILRYADVLLMYAEAINELSGPTPEAYEYLNMLRARARNGDAGPATREVPADYPVGSLTQQEFREAVYRERRLELTFEGRRKEDIDRTGRLVELISRPGINGAENVQPYKVLYPIPSRELELNPLLEQNPGY